MPDSSKGPLAIAASIILAVGCSSGTEPHNFPPPSHPSGSTASRILGLGGRPFGVRVATTGDVLVTEQDLNRFVHLDSAATTSSNVAVGRDPGDVISNATGRTAWVSGFFDGTISVVDLATNTVTKTVPVSSTNAYRLALSANDARLYVTSTDGHLYTITTATETPGPAALLAGALQGLAINHAGNALYVTATSGSVWRLDPGSLATTKSTSLSCQAQDVAVATDDSEVYVACESGSVIVLDPTTLAVKTAIATPGDGPFGLAVSPDNTQLYVTSPGTGALLIIDRANRTIVQSLAIAGTPRRVAFNAHGNKAYIANEGNWIDVIQ